MATPSASAVSQADADVVAAARREAARLADENAPALGVVLDDGVWSTIGNALPDYVLHEEVHRGAQGVVYRAQPRRGGRDVAIKVIRPGPLIGSRDARRFEREIEALARLRHPNIVALHGSGVAAGCLYFIMEYVDGAPLHAWMADNAPGHPEIRATLRLFESICDAVAAAHVRGVIHRDLKPANILVQREAERRRDEETKCAPRSTNQHSEPSICRHSVSSSLRLSVSSPAQPKILDFGLAKLLEKDGIAAADTMTFTGQFVGSLPWASPEQAEGRQDAIDLRTDVYSLGVILYEMLTGRLPYEVRGGLRDALDTIVRTEPFRPRLVRPEIDDELETIILKCLQKARERRYETAGDLTRDVRRYLAGEPIEAKRDSRWYMTRKLIYRHRAAAAVSGLMVLAVLGALALSVMAWRRAAAERMAATQMRYLAEQQRQAAIEAREAAERERSRAEVAEGRAKGLAERAEQQAARLAAVAEFQQQMLVSADQKSVGGDASVRDLLDRASERVDSGAIDNPTVIAAVRETLAKSYKSLGALTQAEDSYRAALAQRVAALAEDASEPRRQALSALTLQLRMKGRYAEAERLLRDALDGAPADTDSLALADNVTQLGWVLREQGRAAEAEPLMQQALSMYERIGGSDDVRTAAAAAAVGWCCVDLQRYDDADALFRRALSTRRAMLSDGDVAIASSVNDLALLAQRRGRLNEAQALLDEALQRYRTATGDDSQETLGVLASLTQLRRAQRDLDGAEVLCRDLLERERRTFGDEHPRVALSLDTLGWILMDQQRFDEAASLLNEALAARRRLLGESHPSTLASLRSLAFLRMRQQQFAAAEPLLRDVLERWERAAGEEAVDTIDSRMHLADALAPLGRLEEAERELSAAWAALNKTRPDDAARRAWLLQRLIHVQRELGHESEATRYEALLLGTGE